MRDRSQALDAFDALQEAAIAVDAEPSYDAGFHVHVNVNGLRLDRRSDMLWQFVRWEPTLTYIAAGRFPEQRRNNAAIRRVLASCAADFFSVRNACPDAPWYQATGYPQPAIAPDLVDFLAIEKALTDEELDELKRDLLDIHYDNDRHTNLNIATRHGTWEFRLWNSTRSSWRMDLFTLLSDAWVNQEFIRCLAVELPTGDVAVDARTLQVCLDLAGELAAAALLDRQLAYLERTGGTDAPLAA